MQIVELIDVLQPRELSLPELRILYPDCNLYSALLFQPEGNVEGTANFVRNKDRTLASRQHIEFLKHAKSSDAWLAACPEYSCPWEVLEHAVGTDNLPAEGNLWVLGCESITQTELESFAARNSPKIEVIFEPLAGTSAGNFFDPVCYLFKAKKDDGQLRNVVLVQFKTEPMGDRVEYYERNNLKLGTKVYKILRPGEHSIKLLTLICSDALAIRGADTLDPIHGRSFILHLQLNRDPRNTTYSLYRTLCFDAIDDDSEVLCLNWAQNVRIHNGTTIEEWKNISGSGLYIKSKDLDLKDGKLDQNHLKGLYLTYWLEKRSFIYFFNYEPGLYEYRATKPWQRYGVNQQAGRTGPDLIHTFQWEPTSATWRQCDLRDSDGFPETCHGLTCNYPVLQSLRSSSLDIERLIHLTCGLARRSSWDHPTSLESYKIETNELVKRITFSQDPAAHSQRAALLGRFGVAGQIILTAANFPVCIRDLSGQCKIHFDRSKPNYNLYDPSGSHPATVVYLGENLSGEELKRAYIELRGMLRTAKADDKRLVVWHRDVSGNIKIYNEDHRPSIDEDDAEHPASFARPEDVC